MSLGLFDVRTKNTTQKERFKTTNLNVVAYLQCIINIILNMTALFVKTVSINANVFLCSGRIQTQLYCSYSEIQSMQ